MGGTETTRAVSGARALPPRGWRSQLQSSTHSPLGGQYLEARGVRKGRRLRSEVSGQQGLHPWGLGRGLDRAGAQERLLPGSGSSRVLSTLPPSQRTQRRLLATSRTPELSATSTEFLWALAPSQKQVTELQPHMKAPLTKVVPNVNYTSQK